MAKAGCGREGAGLRGRGAAGPSLPFRVCSAPSPSLWRPGTGTTTPPQTVSSPGAGGWAAAACGAPQGTGRLTRISQRDACGQIPGPLPAGEKGPGPRKAAPPPGSRALCSSLPWLRGSSAGCDLQSCARVLLCLGFVRAVLLMSSPEATSGTWWPECSREARSASVAPSLPACPGWGLRAPP